MVFLFYTFECYVIVHSWKRFRDYLNPIFSMSVIWTVFTGAYDLLSRMNSGYRVLSNNYYSYVLLFMFVFSTLSFFILRNVTAKDTLDKKYFNDNLNVPVDTVNTFLLLAITANILYVIVLVIAAKTTNPIEIMYRIRQMTRVEDASYLASLIKIPALLFNFTPLILCYIFMYDIKADKRKVIILMLEMFAISFLLATKGRIIRFTLLLLMFLKQKLSKKAFFTSTIIILPTATYFLYVLVINRDQAFFEKNSIGDYCFLYFLSPIAGLDRLLCGELTYVTSGFGPRTLNYFYSLLSSLLGTSIPQYVEPGYVIINTSSGYVTGNVFTGMAPYYLDYGWVSSIVCGVLCSLVYTYIYKKMVKDRLTAYSIFYIINYPYLLFYVFADLILDAFSVSIQEFLAAVLITYFWRKRISIKD